MRQLRTHVISILALIVLVLPACLPFLQADLPRSDDGHLHLYRIIALDDAWTRDGHLYPRYASNLVYGYGAPLFNYFPPVAYIPGALLHRLGLSYVQAFQATMIGALIIAALGMYTLASSTWPGGSRYNRFAGWGAAALYIYSPYLLFDAVGRGTLTEVVALAVLPWALWAMCRLHQGINASTNIAVSWWRLIGLLGLFIPLHNVITLHGGVLILVVGLALFWQSSNRKFLASVLLISGIAAALMSLFFLAPALLEGGSVKIRAVTDALSFIDVTRTLRPLGEIFALPHTADPTNLQAHIPIVYGWPALILALIALWRLRVYHRAWTLLVALTLIVALTVLLMWDTPVGVWLWRTIPLLDYTQFAWRVLGIGSLALAWLGGWGAAALIEGRFKGIHDNPPYPDNVPPQNLLIPALIWAVLFSIIVLYALPWTIARHESLPATSILDAQEHERISGELALSSYSEYLPTWVETPPDPEDLREAFASGQPVPRLREHEAITVQSAEWGGTRGTMTFEASEPTTLLFDWLYTPGWEAHFTNEEAANLPVSVEPYAPHGLVSVEVPAGTYTLEIAWHETVLEQRASLISLIAWLLWGVGAAFYVMWPLVGRLRSMGRSMPDDPQDISWGMPFATIITAVLIILFKLIIIDHAQTPWRSDRYASITQPPIATFADQIFLHEVMLGENTVWAGDDLPIALYWQVGQTPTRDESSLIELRDANGNVVAQGGSFQPGGLAMTHWQPGTYVIEDTALPIPADVPPGTYMVTLGLYDPVSKEQRSVLNADGNPQDVKFTLGSITVERPAAPLPVARFEHATLTDSIELVNYFDALPYDAAPGEEFVFDPGWHLTAPVTEHLRVRLMWYRPDQEGKPCSPDVQTAELVCLPPLDLVPTYPLDQWQVGDVWRGTQTLFVPAVLETNEYRLDVTLINEAGQPVGTPQTAIVHIIAPRRIYDLPDKLKGEAIAWHNGIALAGYRGTMDGFTLYWQTSQPIQANLRLSVQIIDANEQIIAQQDGVPANWTRPVAGWAVGEVIATPYTFDVPEGEYRVRLVWYDAITGERVGAQAGDSEVIEVES